ncbi:MAG: hypothetical protein ACRD3J_06355 [Thermoanaerobaculia bacterium]
MIVLRLIHIICGVFWVGTVFVIAWFLMPAQRATGLAGVSFIEELMIRKKLRVYLILTMVLTILSGLAMYARFMMITHGQWGSSTMAKVLGFGAICGIVAGGIGASSGKRSGEKLIAVADAVRSSGGTPSAAQQAELQAIGNKAASEMKLVAALLVIAVAAMASARYL